MSRVAFWTRFGERVSFKAKGTKGAKKPKAAKRSTSAPIPAEVRVKVGGRWITYKR